MGQKKEKMGKNPETKKIIKSRSIRSTIHLKKNEQ